MTTDLEIDGARQAVVSEMETCVVQLRSMLDAEREALDRLDTVALDVATSSKAQLLQRLESLDAERRQLQDLDSPAESSVAWRSICAQLETCRRINEANGSIVEQQLRGVRRALDIVAGSGAGPPVVYGPGGQAQPPTGSRPLSQA